VKRRPDRQAGVSLVEVVVASAIGAIVLTGASMLLRTSFRDSNAAYVRDSLAIRCADAADLVVRELQLGTLSGEDTNHNGVLNAGEDVNRNGRLDCDWNLADGTAATSITFNSLLGGWMWSEGISYSVRNGVLYRSEKGVDREICRNVALFKVTRSGTMIDIDLSLSMRDRTGKVWSETARRRAHVRN
jgi:prepilin-type N-terminal cleavage/methylation domain-containing protein